MTRVAFPKRHASCGKHTLQPLATSQLDYVLPAERIAVTPADPRDSARMMVVSRGPSGTAAHHHVRDLPGFLRPGDMLVFNTTRVVAARLEGVRADTGGRVDGLYLRPGATSNEWVVMLRGKRMKPGVIVALHPPQAGSERSLELHLLAQVATEPGAWQVRVQRAGEPLTHAGLAELSSVGHVPLPPYILKARRDRGVEIDEASDTARYQTIYAHQIGVATDDASVAAPTAGLHFTPQLLEALKAMGVERVDVTLEVGPGTFKPVDTQTVQEHPMHSERCWVSRPAAERVLAARRDGRRVLAVGTTTCRTLEAYAIEYERTGAIPASLVTDILIAPGHRWRWVDGMLTNFHLPRSTLMALVGACLDDQSGVARLVTLYEEAVQREYRFYSYGDAMLILPCR